MAPPSQTVAGIAAATLALALSLTCSTAFQASSITSGFTATSRIRNLRPSSSSSSLRRGRVEGTTIICSSAPSSDAEKFDWEQLPSASVEESEAVSFIDIIDNENNDVDELIVSPDSDNVIDIGMDGIIELDYDEDDEDRILTDREDRLFLHGTKVEECILIGVEDLSRARKERRAQRGLEFGSVAATGGEDDVSFSMDESLTEMRELIRTAGLELRGEITQRLQAVNPRTYIGTGKVKEAQALLEGVPGCCTVVFDAELSPGQQKALENAFNTKVIENDFLGSDQEEVIKVVDRTALILDIFAQHAKTREGKLQVDLALHQYRKPRLTKMWTHLGRQSGSGGVGLRGMGETQLEVDKRIIRDRILVLQKKIELVSKQRELHRKGRGMSTEAGGLPVLALVGYTNAGKSTLLNALTKAGILAEDMLFATLDPTTRRVKLPGYKTHPEVLLTDTVGFIQKLPTQLVNAFRATLEEVKEADCLIHIVDVSNPSWRKQEAAVISVLNEIGAGDTPIVRTFNKLDLLDREEAETLKLEAATSTDFSVAVSSVTGEGLSDFVAVVEDALSGLLVPVELELPYSAGHELNRIHEVGSVETIDYRENGTYVLCRLPRALAMKLEKYNIANMDDDDDGGGNPDGDADVEEEIDWAALGKGRHAKKL